MKKLILALIGVAPLITIPLQITFNEEIIEENKRNLNKSEQEYANSELESKVDYDFRTRQRYNPTYPTFSKNMNYYGKDRRVHLFRMPSMTQMSDFDSSLDYKKEISTGDRVKWWGQSWTALSINVLNYAPNKSTFLDYYKSVDLNLDYGYNFTNNGSKGWQQSPRGPNMGTPYSKSIYLSLNSSSNSQTFLDEYFQHTNESRHRIEAKIKSSWNGNDLEFEIFINASLDYANGISRYHHGAYIGINSRTIRFNSSYNVNSLKSKVQSALSSSFSITSDTSPNIDSIEKNGKNKEKPSNKQYIETEIDRRLKSSFGSEYSAWFQGSNPILTIDTAFLDNRNVSITLKDKGSISGASQFVTNVKMPIAVNLTDWYYENIAKKEAQKRLVFTPGMIIDPNSLDNKVVKDNPEYDPVKNIFTYHNSVKVQFSAIRKEEIMYVNGEEVPVYDDIYKIDLNDERGVEEGLKSSDNNQYEILVKGIKSGSGQTIELKVTIKIESLMKEINYGWLGWNPTIYPEQKKLITKHNDDGSINEEYDPTINPETGMRNQFIFFSNKHIVKNERYPFLIDPLDKYGIRIKQDDVDREERQFSGLIMEASVANSGVKLLQAIAPKDWEKIAKIERVELHPETFTKKGNVESIRPVQNEQWSKPGLWHYIVYLKDYVDQYTNPSEPGKVEIKAKSGSTVHKLIYLSNEFEDYTSFLNISKIKSNQYVSEFFDSIPGRHFKNYLLNYTSINTSQKIEELSYEEIIVYWRRYVSGVETQKIPVPSEPVNYKDLRNLKLSSLKMNEINPVEVKNKIINYVKEKIKKFSVKAEYEVDYEIYDRKGVLLKEIDLNDFVNIQEKNKEIELVVKSISTSALLTNSTNYFKVINNKDYQEEKVLDLSKINIDPIEYDFTSSSEEVKQKFKDNYIFNYVFKILEGYRPSGVEWDYIYGEDYYISLEGFDGIDLKVDPNANEKINEFLNSSKKVSLEITIISIDESIKTTGYGSYLIINDPDSEEIAPVEPPDPTIPGKPTNPQEPIGPQEPTEPVDPNQPNPNDPNKNPEETNGSKVFRIWIIIVIVSVIIIGSIIGVIFWKRRKVKRIK